MLALWLHIDIPETHVVAPDHPLPPPMYISKCSYESSNAAYIAPMQSVVQRLLLQQAVSEATDSPWRTMRTWASKDNVLRTRHFLRGTIAAFNEKLEVAEQNRSLRIVTRLIVLGADHVQPRRRHLGGELYRFTHQETTFGVDGWICICPA